MAIQSLQQLDSLLSNNPGGGQPTGQQIPMPASTGVIKQNQSNGSINSLQQLDSQLANKQTFTGAVNQPAYDEQDPLIKAISDIGGYAENAAENLPGNIYNLASQVPGAAQKVITNPKGALQDVAGGVARGAQNLAAALGEAGQAIGTGIPSNIYKYWTGKDLNIPQINIREELGLGKNNPIDLGSMIESNEPNPFLEGIGQYGLGASALGTKAIPMITANALNMAAQAPPGQRLEAATEGAVNAGLPIGSLKGAAKIYDVARPSNLFRGSLSPEELQANLEAAKGTATGLGDVIASPGLKLTQENILEHVPFSGVLKQKQQIAADLTQKGQDLLNKIDSTLPEGDRTSLLQDALTQAANKAKQEKNANYEKVNQIADNAGVTIGRDNFSKKAQEILSNIEQSPELKREISPSLLSDITSYAKGTKPEVTAAPENKIIMPSGIEDPRSLSLPTDEGQSLKLSNIFKGKLNDKANAFYTNGQNYEYGLMRDLKDALGQDIDEGIQGSGDSELKQAYDKAQQEYGTKYKPFEDPDITKFTRQGGDADTILSRFLKTNTKDERATLLSKLTDKLPQENQYLPLQMYLSRAIENNQLQPTKLSTLYHALGDKQKDLLIPDNTMRQALDKYVRSVDLNKESFGTMFNPKTGNRTLEALIGALESGIGAHGTATMLGSVAGAGGALAGGALLSRLGNKLLTNEKVRTSLVNKMIKNAQK